MASPTVYLQESLHCHVLVPSVGGAGVPLAFRWSLVLRLQAWLL